MLLQPTREFQDIPSSKITVANWASQTWEVMIPQNQPIEWIDIIFSFTVANAITYTKAGGLLNMLKKVIVEFNDGARGKRNVVSVSGLGLLEYNSKVYNSLDPSTLATLAEAITGTHAASKVHRITYRIPFAHPQITAEPLRTRFYLPAHLTTEQPKLTIITGAAADFGTQSNPISALTCEVVFKQRYISAKQQDALAKDKGAGLKNGYFAQDLLETPYSLSASLSDSEQRFAIPMPGQYTGVLCRMLYYQTTNVGGLIYGDLSAVTTPGNETVWGLEMATQNFGKWRWYQLWLEQAMSGFRGHSSLVYSPDFLPSAAANTFYSLPSSIYIDRLSEGEGGEADEFSSLLDVNVPSNQGIRMDIVGRVTTPSGGSSVFSILGHRLLDDLRPWQVGRLIG